jgi:hypothetical protein
MMAGLALVFFFVSAQVGSADLGIIVAVSAIGSWLPAGLPVALAGRICQALVLGPGIGVLVFSGGLSTSHRGLRT